MPSDHEVAIYVFQVLNCLKDKSGPPITKNKNVFIPLVGGVFYSSHKMIELYSYTKSST